MFTSAATYCPLCPGQGSLLGRLGRLRWFRCRDCGMDFSRPCRSPVRPTSSREKQGARHG